jgi:hypothetical protein
LDNYREEAVSCYTAVLVRKAGLEHPDLRGLLIKVAGKLFFLIPLASVRHNFLRHEAPNLFSKGTVLLGIEE